MLKLSLKSIRNRKIFVLDEVENSLGEHMYVFFFIL